MGRPPGTTVFVGNISYDTTEDQLKEVFSQVGNVVSFRLMYDHDTGRAKGFGFCEYEDKETAMSARRNLNGTHLNGRPLRVDLTDSDKNNPALNGLGLNQPVSNLKLSNPNQPQSQGNLPPHLAQGHPGQMPVQQHPALPPALASANPSMAMMPLADIHKTMIHLKNALVQGPNEMRELLTANPRLAHAILQGQIMLGMVPPPLMSPMSQQPKQGDTPQQPPQQPPMQQQPQQQQQQPLGKRQSPMQAPSGPPRPTMVPPRPVVPPPRPNMPVSRHAGPTHPSAPPPQPPPQQPHAAMQKMQMPGQHGPPPHMMQPRMMQPHNAPPMQGASAPPAPQDQASMDEQTAILSRVMTMSEQEIDSLPAEHRNYVLELKQILAMQNAGVGPPGSNQQMPLGMPPGGRGPPSVGQGPGQPQPPYR